jgi:hypothetical protein
MTSAASSHLQILGTIYTDHLKAANLLVETTTQKGLSIYAPLPERSVRQMDSNLSTFLQNYGKSLSQWQQAALAAVPMPGSPGGNSGSGASGGPGGVGSFYGSAGGGTNVFSGFGMGLAYGKDAGVVLKGGIEDIEHGQIFTGKKGQPIKLPQNAKYDRNLSDQYRSIFTLPNGRALSFMHGDMSQSFKNGQLLKAGTVIGHVAPNGDPSASSTYVGTTPTGAQTSYKSTPDIVEFGVYDNPQDAFKRNVPFSHTYNPNQYLSSLGQGGSPNSNMTPGGSGSGSGGGGGPYPSWISVTKNGKQIFLRDPRLIRDYMNAGNKYFSSGLTPQALVAQGFQESGWQAGAVNPTNVPGYGHALGISQFMRSTANGFGIDPFNPDQSIGAQAKYMVQLMAGTGNLTKGWNGYGTGDITSLMNSVQFGPPAHGGSSSVGGAPTGSFEATIQLIYPNGMKQTVTGVTFRPKHAGIPNTHEGQAAREMGGKAPKR